jgi:hypothetical protein
VVHPLSAALFRAEGAMTIDRPDLQLLLLDAIAMRQPFPAERIGALDEQQWQEIGAMVAAHRLQPLIHHRLAANGATGRPPEEQAKNWSKKYYRHGLRSLTLQWELITLHDLLTAAGVPYLALKGAYLAWHAYPEPGLRPLRDLDLLVPRDRAIELFQALLDRGFIRSKVNGGDLRVHLEESHQLPPLHSPSGEITVEIHTLIYHLDDRRPGVTDPSEDPAFWERGITRMVSGRALRFPSPEDILIHLIEHAVYGHEFDNGPLLLSDIGFLLECESIDWSLFWRLADAAQCRRGAMLSLALVRHYWPDIEIAWSGGDQEIVPEAVILAAAHATLSYKHDVAKSEKFLVRFHMSNNGLAKIAYIWRKLFPEISAMKMMYPARSGTCTLPWYYFMRIFGLLVGRGPSFLKSVGSESGEAVAKLVLIRHWLGKGA